MHLFSLTRSVRLARCTLLCGLTASAAQAGSVTTFDPEVMVGYGYNNNVAAGGGGSGAQSTVFDDNYAVIDLLLPVEHRWKTGDFDLRYSPRLLRYDTFDQLDRTDHFLDFRLTDTPTRRGELELIVNASSTQVQGNPGDENPADAFLSRRTDRHYFRGDAIYRHRFARTWRWSALATSRLYRFDDIDGVPDMPNPTTQVEDRDVWALAFQVDKQVSERTLLGGRYERSKFDLEVSGEADTDAFLFSYQRELDRRSELEFNVGAFTTKGTAVVDCSDAASPDACEAGDTTQASDRSTGFQGDVNYRRRWEDVALRVTAGHRPSAGGNLLGAIRYSWVQASLSRSTASAAWRWSVVPRWAWRDPLDDQQADRQSWSISGTVTRRIVTQLDVRFRTNYVEQVSDSPSVDERDIWTAEIGLVWAPWRGTRVAER